jgi:hypothetical protein
VHREIEGRSAQSLRIRKYVPQYFTNAENGHLIVNQSASLSFAWAPRHPAVPLIHLYRNHKNFQFALPMPLTYPDTVGSSLLSAPTGIDPKKQKYGGIVCATGVCGI